MLVIRMSQSPRRPASIALKTAILLCLAAVFHGLRDGFWHDSFLLLALGVLVWAGLRFLALRKDQKKSK